MFAYARNPVADWDYYFFATSHGAPFSDELEIAVQDLINTRILADEGSVLSVTSNGQEHLEQLKLLKEASAHSSFLQAATQTSLFYPPGLAQSAIKTNPDMKMRNGRTTVRLFGDYAMNSTYEALARLRELVGTQRTADLTVPALAWIAFYSRNLEHDTLNSEES